MPLMGSTPPRRVFLGFNGMGIHRKVGNSYSRKSIHVDNTIARPRHYLPCRCLIGHKLIEQFLKTSKGCRIAATQTAHIIAEIKINRRLPVSGIQVLHTVRLYIIYTKRSIKLPHSCSYPVGHATVSHPDCAVRQPIVVIELEKFGAHCAIIRSIVKQMRQYLFVWHSVGHYLAS